MADDAHPTGPHVLLDLSFELAPPLVACVPCLEGPSGLEGLVQQWLAGLLEHGNLVKRLDVGEGELTIC